MHISENIQKKLYNLQVKLEEFTDQIKKYRIVGIELSINDNTKSSRIPSTYRKNVYQQNR